MLKGFVYQGKAMLNLISVRIAVLFVFAGLLAATQNATAAVGKVDGNFSVTSKGEINYRIPIWVPAGPNGVQPNLSINYKGGRENGLLGMGWNLDGLSSIELCGRNLVQDASLGSNPNPDRYCVDGKRLRLVSGTKYGDENSTYHTELADFSLVTALGPESTRSFKIQRKDGLIYEYGVTSDARILRGSISPSPVKWMLNKVSDRSGSSYTITYASLQVDTVGDVVPVALSWGPIGSGSSIYNYKATLAYTQRSIPDIRASAFNGNGSVYQNTNRLASITVQNGSTVLRYYVLGYDLSLITSQSRLRSVTECSDSAMANCLSPTSVSYFGGTPGLSNTTYTGVTSATTFIALEDFDADGRDDLLYSAGNTLYLAKGSSSSGLAAPIGLVGTIDSSAVFVGNISGLSNKEFIAKSGGYWYSYYFSGSTLVATNTGVAVDATKALCEVKDVTGDGLPDLIFGTVSGTAACNSEVGQLSIYLNVNSSANHVVSFSPSILVTTTSRLYAAYPSVGDTNGDGISELAILIRRTFCGLLISCMQFPPMISRYQWDGVTLALVSTSWVASPTEKQMATTRTNFFWNDDKCSDNVVQGTNVVTVEISSCTTTVAKSLTVPGKLVGTIDWNGDGRSDLLVNQNNGLYVYLSTGDGVGAGLTTAIKLTATSSIAKGDINGDGFDDVVIYNSDSSAGIQYILHNSSPLGAPDFVSNIADGFGVSVGIDYASLGDSNIYTPGTGAVAPEVDITSILARAYDPVVKKLTVTDGVAGAYTLSYKYQGGRENIAPGRAGFLGFQSITVSDSRPNSQVVKTYYKQSFPYTDQISQRDVYQNDGTKLISSAVNTFDTLTLDSAAGNQRYFPYISATAVDRYEVEGPKNGLLISRSNYGYTYDSYGNLTTSTATISDKDSAAPQSPTYNQSWTTSISSTFVPNTANWCLGLPTDSVVTKSSSIVGESAVTKRVAYTPDYVKCRTIQKVVEPSSTMYKVTTDLAYDAFGNIGALTVTGVGMAARTTSSNWGPTGQRAISVTNAEGQTNSATYDNGLGLLVTATDPNGLVTTRTYDGFGRVLTEVRPDSTSTSYGYNDCAAVAGGCLNGDPASTNTGINKMVIIATDKDSSGVVIRDTWTYLDQFNRPIVTKTKTLTGGYTRVGTQYDALGRVSRQTMPCDAASCNVYWQTNTYDMNNRVIQLQRPVSAGNSTLQTTAISYQGMTTVITDALGKTRTTVTDPNGWLRRSVDHNGYYQNFNYDGFGSLKAATDSNGNALFSANYAYGLSAYQTSSTDMDLGTWSYVPNALGEVVSQTDAKGNTISMAYDKLSRPTVRNIPGEGTTNWVWGTSAASYNIGQLQSLSSTNGTTENYTYDNKARLSQKNVIADGTTYSYNYTYNSLGTLDTVAYPVSTSSYRLQLKYVYSNGMLQQVKDNAAGTVFWQANASNARGQITQEALGNGIITNRSFDAVTGVLNSIQSGLGGGTGVQNESYLFDQVGNVIQRQNNMLGLTESFCYDNLYRLAKSALSGDATCTTANNLTVNYNNMGNVSSRSDIASGAAWTYHASKKHAVTQAGPTAYTYDANGNMITRGGYGITWNKDNFPTLINGAGESIALAYNANRQRWKQVYTAGANTETTYYVGDVMEKVITASATDYRHYIYASGRAAVAVMSRSSTGANVTRYMLEDHQDSIAKITTSTGTIVVSENFTAFGNRRNPTTWSGAPTSGDLATISTISRKGYTWQTALGNLGLNHMNGRVQDAIIGRFISPDPYIFEPNKTQNYNRYGYVYNNPLSAIDPTGYDTIFVPCRPGPNCIEEVISSLPPLPPAIPGGFDDYPSIYVTANSFGSSDGMGGASGNSSSPQTQKPGNCPNTAGNYAKQFVYDTASTILGIADAFTFGGYTKMTESLGLGTVNHDLAYNSGLYGTAAISGGRLLYAGASSVIQSVPAISAADAVATRNTLKGVFSTLGADHPRAYSLDNMMAKYGSEAEVIKAASRTDANLNTAAAELGYSAASQTGVSGCP